MGVVIIGLIAYLIGSVNFSVLISQKMAGFDVREKGSGNGGTTNVLRTVGKKAAALTLIADILKGIVAVLIAYFARKIFKMQSSNTCASSRHWSCCRAYISSIFRVPWRQGNCDKLRNIIIAKLENWFNLFDFCLGFDGNN